MPAYTVAQQSTYDFEYLAPAILGHSEKAATVLALLDYDSTIAIDDVQATHNAIYSQLPVGTPTSCKDLNFIKIRTSTGKITAIAFAWLASQPVLVTTKTINISIPNVSMSRILELRDLLNEHDFAPFVLTTSP